MLQVINKGKYNELVATEGYIHKKGDNSYSEIKRCILLPTLSVDDYEEVFDIPKYTAEEYKAKVVELIRTKYSLDDELGIQRQRDTKPEEFDEFNSYVEECKIKAKELLNNGTEISTEGENF